MTIDAHNPALKALDIRDKQSLVDCLFAVQNGDVSCRRMATEIQKQLSPDTGLTNGKIMSIMEEVASEWAKDTKASVSSLEAVVSYLNCLCCKWMGGNWGLQVKHITSNTGEKKP